MVSGKGKPANDQPIDYDVDSLRDKEREELAKQLIDDYMSED